MARKNKSVNDIMNQFNSIADIADSLRNPETQNVNRVNRRVNRARDIAFRYYDNIRNAAGKEWNYNDDRSFDKKYSRSTYMGLANNAG